MSSVTPQTLPLYTGSVSTYTGPFVWNSTVSINGVDHEVYYNNTTGNANNVIYSIAVNTATNTWVDYGNDHPFNAPVEVTESNGDITIVLSSNGYPNLFKFLKPTVASWISSSGAGGGALPGGPGQGPGAVPGRKLIFWE